MKIRKGHTITLDGARFLVLGNMKMRGNYFYLVRASSGEKHTMRRAALLECIATGRASVS